MRLLDKAKIPYDAPVYQVKSKQEPKEYFDKTANSINAISTPMGNKK